MSEPSSAERPAPRWFVRGDLDGFFGLALDNLVQVLVILGLCRFVLGFTDEIVFGRMLPGIGISLLVGNLFYAWQGYQLARKTGRDDVCALPYGINTLSLFAHVFLVMLPIKLTAAKSGASPEEASRLAFAGGVLAAAGSGIIEAGGAWAVAFLRRWTPRAALLSTLAGIAITFIAAAFFFQTFASPVVAFLPLGIVLLVYFGRVKFPLGIPGGLAAVLVGVALAWTTGLVSYDAKTFASAVGTLGLHLPVPVVSDIAASLTAGHLTTYLGIIIPMGLFNVVGSVQNLDSAAATGDDYPTVPSLVANGVGTLVGAAFGSPFPTTIYIGHPGWKSLGARLGYSVLNGAFFTVLALSGATALLAAVVPIESGMAIVLWIGIVMVAQAFQATPREHAPAVAMGILPGVAAWGSLMIKAGYRVSGKAFDPGMVASLSQSGTHAAGAFAIEHGVLLTAMIWAAVTVSIIERRFLSAAAWAGSASLLSAVGLMHRYAITPADVVQDVGFSLQPGDHQFTLAYALLGGLLIGARWLPKAKGDGGH